MGELWLNDHGLMMKGGRVSPGQKQSARKSIGVYLGILSCRLEVQGLAENRAPIKKGMRATQKRKKGPGYFSELKRPDNYISTELSIGVNIDGKEIEIPSLVPTLTKDEIDYLLQGNKPTKEIVNKAVEHARKRLREGKDPFAQKGER